MLHLANKFPENATSKMRRDEEKERNFGTLCTCCFKSSTLGFSCCVKVFNEVHSVVQLG